LITLLLSISRLSQTYAIASSISSRVNPVLSHILICDDNWDSAPSSVVNAAIVTNSLYW